jgi:hypothetical protein
MNVRHHLATALLALASLGAQAATVYGSNLIVNGDAEGDMAAWQTFDGYALFQSVDYGPNWVLPTQPGPADRGAHMFTGVGARSAGYQQVDLPWAPPAGSPNRWPATSSTAARPFFAAAVHRVCRRSPSSASPARSRGVPTPRPRHPPWW